jgi:hypothetical protein
MATTSNFGTGDDDDDDDDDIQHSELSKYNRVASRPLYILAAKELRSSASDEICDLHAF